MTLGCMMSPICLTVSLISAFQVSADVDGNRIGALTVRPSSPSQGPCALCLGGAVVVLRGRRRGFARTSGQR